jgi:TetR/AcrR family transcriptional repressor of nem operon
MARPQAFDQQQVLQNAMELFWRQSYASTSIRDLTEATKLQPGSLYGAFKSKWQLFFKRAGSVFQWSAGRSERDATGPAATTGTHSAVFPAAVATDTTGYGS